MKFLTTGNLRYICFFWAGSYVPICSKGLSCTTVPIISWFISYSLMLNTISFLGSAMSNHYCMLDGQVMFYKSLQSTRWCPIVSYVNMTPNPRLAYCYIEVVMLYKLTFTSDTTIPSSCRLPSATRLQSSTADSCLRCVPRRPSVLKGGWEDHRKFMGKSNIPWENQGKIMGKYWNIQNVGDSWIHWIRCFFFANSNSINRKNSGKIQLARFDFWRVMINT